MENIPARQSFPWTERLYGFWQGPSSHLTVDQTSATGTSVSRPPTEGNLPSNLSNSSHFLTHTHTHGISTYQPPPLSKFLSLPQFAFFFFFCGAGGGGAAFQGMWDVLVPRPGIKSVSPVGVLTTRGPGKSPQSAYLKSVILSRKKAGSDCCLLGGGGQDSAEHSRKPRVTAPPTPQE